MTVAFWQLSKIDLFAKIVYGFAPLTILKKGTILDVWQGYKSASATCFTFFYKTFIFGIVLLIALVQITKPYYYPPKFWLDGCIKCKTNDRIF